jgi:dTDP-4-amino-4,6-dideoxygalactose transaminase
MWVSKRLDFTWRDLLVGLAGCAVPGRRLTWARRVERRWSPDGTAIACLTVRSGFDLLLTAVAFPRRSEVLFTALTIGDMPRLAEQHGLVPIPVDVDRESVSPRLDDLERAITADTKAIVVTHLYGGRVDVGPIVTLCRDHGLLLIEDCAQAYAGVGYTGHPESDVTMFSFGPIKTATALGGALLRVRDETLRHRMCEIQRQYPVQSTPAYGVRLLKYAMLHALSGRRVYGAICSVARMLRIDHDRVVHGLTRSFSGRANVRRLRRQPCAALMRLLHRRLHEEPSRLRRRAADGAALQERLAGIVCPGGSLSPHHYWVFPVLADQPAPLVEALREAGFDATVGRSLDVVERPAGRADADNATAQTVLSHTVFLPFYPEIPDEAWERMAGIVREAVDAPAVSRPDPATSVGSGSRG